MNDNKNLPAFPISCGANETGIYSLLDARVGSDCVGVTKLEFFACNAPVDIPSWFTHVSPEKNVTPQPTWNTLPKDAQEHIKLWFSENTDLPEELQWFGEQWKKHEAEDLAFRKADWAAKYFQWRRYYAEQLLNELSKA